MRSSFIKKKAFDAWNQYNSRTSMFLKECSDKILLK